MPAKKRDANHNEIKNALIGAGLTVFDTASLGMGFPDLVAVENDGRVWLVEVKQPEGRFTPDEVRFILKLCNEAYRVAMTTDDVLRMLG